MALEIGRETFVEKWSGVGEHGAREGKVERKKWFSFFSFFLFGAVPLTNRIEKHEPLSVSRLCPPLSPNATFSLSTKFDKHGQRPPLRLHGADCDEVGAMTKQIERAKDRFDRFLPPPRRLDSPRRRSLSPFFRSNQNQKTPGLAPLLRSLLPLARAVRSSPWPPRPLKVREN